VSRVSGRSALIVKIVIGWMVYFFETQGVLAIVFCLLHSFFVYSVFCVVFRQ